MDEPQPPEISRQKPQEHVPATWIHSVALAALTAVGVVLCVRMALPFLPALAWAVAFAVIAFPLHRWLCYHLPGKNWPAGVTVTVVVLVIVIPALFAVAQMSVEAQSASAALREKIESGEWRETLDRTPWLQRVRVWFEANANPQEQAKGMIGQLFGDVMSLLGGSAWAAIQFLVMVFALFYCLRDRDRLREAVRSLLPVTKPEADHLFTRVDDSIQATVFATFAVGVLQGGTGALMFWALGLPAPILWGVVMTVLAILPVLGAFIVWMPAAIYLATSGQIGAAAALVAWGGIMAGPVGNYLYARLAGDRMSLHPVPALIAFVGGLAIFGVSGMVVGPAIVAVTLALIELWKERSEPSAS